MQYIDSGRLPSSGMWTMHDGLIFGLTGGCPLPVGVSGFRFLIVIFHYKTLNKHLYG
jgi:hypothetical protein